MDGLTSAETARAEAWEEAGVCDGIVSSEPVLIYNSTKVTKRNGVVFTRVAVHTIAVTETDTTFPEADRRNVRWVTRREADLIICQENLRDAVETLFAQVSQKA